MPDLPSPGDGAMPHGHLAVPGGPGTPPPPERWPGVVVIHEAFGLTEGIREQTDRLASRRLLALCAPRDGFAAVSVNYGEVPDDAETSLEGACPVVGSFGARDPMGTKPPNRLEQALTTLGVPHDIKIYPEDGHRFMHQPQGPLAPLAGAAHMAYHESAAEDSWRRIFAFFDEHLRP